MTEFDDDFEEDFSYLDDEAIKEKRLAIFERARVEPAFDVFSDPDGLRLEQPKREIGKLVAEQGFRVPVIEDQATWEQAFDDGTAMLRSEMPQDYDGLSGLLNSERLIHSPYSRQGDGFIDDLGSVIMRGLRSGELHPTDYMSTFRGQSSWSEVKASRILDAMYFGVVLDDIYNESASHWRYVDGDNIIMFADPNVEGRYHFGVTPREDQTKNWQQIGGYIFEPGEHEIPQTSRKHYQPFVAKPFVEFYEQISALPFFDNTQNPVIELQLDTEGNIHFLQYLKTGQKKEYIDPFDLPLSNEILTVNDVRGITDPGGKEMRLFIAPTRLSPGMEGQGIFCNIIQPRGFETQLASRVADFVLHQAYISFQDNHFDSAPLYRPPLAAGMSVCYEKTDDSLLRNLDDLFYRGVYGPFHSSYHKLVAYIDIKVTSNGREATIESDWELKTVSYSDL
jgi:hypothetical protein